MNEYSVYAVYFGNLFWYSVTVHKVFLKVSKNFERFSPGQSKEDDIKEKEQQGDGGMKKCNKV